MHTGLSAEQAIIDYNHLQRERDSENYYNAFIKITLHIPHVNEATILSSFFILQNMDDNKL